MAIDGTRSTAAYSRFAEEMDIGSDGVEVNTRGGPEESGKLGFIKSCLLARWKLWGIMVLCLLSFLFGFLLTHVMVTSCVKEPGTNPPTPQKSSNGSTEDHQGEGRKYSEVMANHIKVHHFKYFLQQFTMHNNTMSHESGSDGSNYDARDIKKTWKAQGFDVTSKTYKVQLTRPNITERSSLVITGAEPEFNITPDNQEKESLVLPPFTVNSPSGDIDPAAPIFIDYGMAKDFEYLKIEGDLSVEGRVCVFKLGMVQTPLLVQRCAEHGGVGVIAFPDPADYANGQGYPDGNSLPSNAFIRDNASPLFGDPRTPSLPSSGGVVDDTNYNITLLPTMIISADDAARLLSVMSLPVAPSAWIGDLSLDGKDAIYNVGSSQSGFQANGQRMKMSVRNEQVLKDITNVFGTLRGSTEPDRYIIFGCHRDSLTPGAVEPGTGMAVFMELTRLVKQLQIQGWSPRRTIIFASWDGGDDGHIGSTEWVEENKEILNQRAVVYINLDEAVSGQNSFAAEGSAIFAKSILQAISEVNSPDPDMEGQTVLDNWKIKNPGTNEYQLRPLGVNSDATPFLHIAGVPSVDLKYTYSKNGKHIPRYPLWHTSLDTVHYVETFIDTDWQKHRAMTEIAGRLLLMYADDIVLPVDVNDYATVIESYYLKLQLTYPDFNLDQLERAVDKFKAAARKFHSTFIQQIDVKNDLQVREANDRLVAVERAFLSSDEKGHMYPQLRHMIYGPSSIGAYEAEGLSPLSYALHLANSTTYEIHEQRLQVVLSSTSVAVEKAANALLVDGLFT